MRIDFSENIIFTFNNPFINRKCFPVELQKKVINKEVIIITINQKMILQKKKYKRKNKIKCLKYSNNRLFK